MKQERKSMKKQYISPNTLVITITNQLHILTGSPGISTCSDSADENLEILSRQGNSFWDDEE